MLLLLFVLGSAILAASDMICLVADAITGSLADLIGIKCSPRENAKYLSAPEPAVTLSAIWNIANMSSNLNMLAALTGTKTQEISALQNFCKQARIELEVEVEGSDPTFLTKFVRNPKHKPSMLKSATVDFVRRSGPSILTLVITNRRFKYASSRAKRYEAEDRSLAIYIPANGQYNRRDKPPATMFNVP